ncbi:MAG: error-prone DNA polymerase [Opitutales bacterium]|nr:error-prone DNA polymerase [Opitutales bacterium]
MNYIELHARSAFSFLRGASQPDELAKRAAERGLPGMALCDRDGFYGAPRFHAAAEEVGVRPYVGTELTMEDDTVLPLLVQSRRGYRNLCKLISQSKLTAAKGESQITWNHLADFTEGLIALTGDRDGPLLQGWADDREAGMNAGLQRIRRIFPKDQVYVEIQRHQVRDEDLANRALKQIAEANQLPLLATNGVTYAQQDGRRIQDVFTCLRHHTHLDVAGRLLAENATRHIRSAQEMSAMFADLPDAVAESVRLAERLEFSLNDLGYEFPEFPVEAGDSMDAFLCRATYAGAQRRYGVITPGIKKQLDHELDLITRLGFSGYFLIVWDLVRYCQQENIMVQGRGSAANSAVCYSLGITACDPIGGKLLFERFLSEGRKSWPDIDLDLPSGDRRERVIQHVYERYGRTGAAMTANVITYKGRSAVRELGKVLHFPEELVGRFADLYASGDYPHTLELEEQLEQAGIRSDHPRAPALVTLYQQLYGLPRHLGQHSGGMVICQGQLDEVVPLENASMPGRSVVQWDKDDCDAMGIVKVDLLGLGMMAAIQDAITLTQERGHPVDLAQIPTDDPETYALMTRADTIGVFQIESRAQMATLPRMKPRTFYDLVIEVAIIRPGPIVGNLAHPYLERRAGRQDVSYIDARLEPVLERTLGVPLFQEQVLKMAMVMANFSGSQAERLRKALSFHRSDKLMDRVQDELRAALQKNEVAPNVIEEVVAAISSFALYGFPESHAISFATLAYGSAYLKTHYPAEFYTGLLNNQPMGFYSSATLIQDARRHGLRFRAPCAVNSTWETGIINNKTLQLGLCQLSGVSKKAIESLLRAREARPFENVADFCRRGRLCKDELRVLAESGALNQLSGDRRAALWQVESYSAAEDDLFALVAEESADYHASPLPEMGLMERVQADFASTGVTTGSHPMKRIRAALPQYIKTAAALAEVPNGTFVATAGAVICRQRPGTAKGVVFISLEDETGVSNSIVYPQLFEEKRILIKSEPFLLIHGVIQHADGTTHLKAKRILPLKADDLPAGASHDFR